MSRRGYLRDAAKERFWRRVLKRQARSGLTGRAFCRREGLSEPSYYGWKRIIAERDVEVARAASASAVNATAKGVTAQAYASSESTARTAAARDEARLNNVHACDGMSSFLPVTIVGPRVDMPPVETPPVVPCLEIVTPQGWQVRLPCTLERSTLAALLEVVTARLAAATIPLSAASSSTGEDRAC
jgi:hypothetical protein